jgi:hypothetical protein
LQAIEDAVEKIPSLGVAMDGGVFRRFKEGFGGVRIGDWGAGGRVGGFEGEVERGGDGGVLEVEVLRAVAEMKGFASGFAPGVEVGFEGDSLH